MDWASGIASGDALETSSKTLAQIRTLFYDHEAASRMPADLELYRVQAYMPVAAGTEGGLYWGNTTLQPGKVGDEYFMTKGHFHRVRNRALLLMDEAGVTRYEEMSPGSVHYIPGSTAHRVANTGEVPLVFAACWPSDAGYDYETIEHEGFSARLLEREGKPTLVLRGKETLAS
jgi:glucose-6-phosphate isomerase